MFALFTYYTATTSEKIINNQQSKSRLTSLDEAFRSTMGAKWPIVLFIMILIVTIAMLCLYFAMRKQPFNLTVGDGHAHTLNVTFIIFTVIFGIVMVVLAIRQWQKYKKDQDFGNAPNYTPAAQEKKKDLEIAAIIGFGLLLLIGGGLAIWYFFLGGKAQMQQK
jgi:amino acid transporter